MLKQECHRRGNLNQAVCKDCPRSWESYRFRRVKMRCKLSAVNTCEEMSRFPSSEVMAPRSSSVSHSASIISLERHLSAGNGMTFPVISRNLRLHSCSLGDSAVAIFHLPYPVKRESHMTLVVDHTTMTVDPSRKTQE